MENTTLTWLLKKQPIVTLSTCKVKYVAASCNVCHVVWLRNLLNKLEIKQKRGTVIRIDNKSAIELVKVKEGNMELEHVRIRGQVANMFMKPLPTTLFKNSKRMIEIWGAGGYLLTIAFNKMLFWEIAKVRSASSND